MTSNPRLAFTSATLERIKQLEERLHQLGVRSVSMTVNSLMGAGSCTSDELANSFLDLIEAGLDGKTKSMKIEDTMRIEDPPEVQLNVPRPIGRLPFTSQQVFQPVIAPTPTLRENDEVGKRF